MEDTVVRKIKESYDFNFFDEIISFYYCKSKNRFKAIRKLNAKNANHFKNDDETDDGLKGYREIGTLEIMLPFNVMSLCRTIVDAKRFQSIAKNTGQIIVFDKNTCKCPFYIKFDVEYALVEAHFEVIDRNHGLYCKKECYPFLEFKEKVEKEIEEKNKEKMQKMKNRAKNSGFFENQEDEPLEDLLGIDSVNVSKEFFKDDCGHEVDFLDSFDLSRMVKICGIFKNKLQYNPNDFDFDYNVECVFADEKGKTIHMAYHTAAN